MRDPKRCSSVCDVVGYWWQARCPDLRFMQLMSNFTLWLGTDPFYMEDDEFLKKFIEYMKTIDYTTGE